VSIRAIRNNNPGNIDAHDHWQGLMPYSSMTPEQKAEPRFAVFQSPRYGFRAMAVLLLNYQRSYRLNTIRQFTARWAPTNENNTAGYSQRVAADTGYGEDQVLDLQDHVVLEKLLKAFSTVEVGSWAFQWADVTAGVALALS
jgi:hypothetical protein